MTLSEKTFPCKDCTRYKTGSEFPANRRWCKDLDNDGYQPIQWDSKTGWSCLKKEKKTNVQLTFDF